MSRARRISRFTLLALLLISGVWLWQSRQLYFDYDLERFFPVSDPNTAFFNDFRARFGNDNDYILIGLEPGHGIFEGEFLLAVEELTRALEDLSGVEEVVSPTRFRYQERNSNPFGPRIISSPFLHLDQPWRHAADSSRIFGQQGWIRSFFSTDRRSLAIQVLHQPMLNDGECARLATEIRNLVEGLQTREARIAGKCFGQTTFIRTLERETVLFTGTSVFMVLVLLFWAYRNLWGVLLPMVVVGLSVLWTVGLMAMLGKPFDLISNIIPTILLVIGIADAVHLVTHFQLYRRTGLPLRAALGKAMREVGAATLMTTLTTAVGFLTLTTSTFAPLIDMGWMATLGIFAALLLTYTLLPAVIILRGEIFQGASNRSGRWNKGLLRVFQLVMKNQAWVLVVSLVLILVSLAGASRMVVNSFLLEDLKADHPRRQAFQFFEDRFSGARGLELALVANDSAVDMLSLQNLERVALIEQYLRDQYGAGSLVSPAGLLMQAHQVYRGGEPGLYRLPGDSLLAKTLIRQLKKEGGEEAWNKFVYEGDRTWLRVRGLTRDEGSMVFRTRDRELLEWFEASFPGAPFEVRLTGTPYLLDLNTGYLARNVLVGLLLAVGLVGGVFALLLGSVRLGLLSLIPNLLPLLLVSGIMGFAGIDLKISTSIIFIISFGIAVDDSIHFLARFQREMKKRKSVRSALRHTYVSTGKAILLTSMILMAGFCTLGLSSFLGTFYLGVLVALTLVLAAVADLTLLPVLLSIFYQKQGSRKNSPGPL